MSKKFLFIRLSSIGDIVLTSPAVRCLKNQVPEAEIHFLTKQGYSYILKSNPNISKVFEYNDNMPELLEKLKAENYDWIIDLHNNFRSWRVKSCLRSKFVTVKKFNFQKFLLVQFKIDRLPESHISERNIDVLKKFKVKYDGAGLDFFIPEGKEFPLKDLPDVFQNGYVAFVIGGTYTTKKFPIEKVIEVCRNIDYPVILLGGKEEYEDGEHALSQSKGNILNFAGKINLLQSASLVRDARLVITNDTGLMHIAAAYRKRILSIWGNTVPRLGFSPFEATPESQILELKNLSCRPCSKLGKKRCPKKHFKCMIDIPHSSLESWINNNF